MGWLERTGLSNRKAHPDALAWGNFQGKETLFGIVFSFLGPPRTIKQAARNICQVPPDAALIFAPWTKFGELPMPVWGDSQPGCRQLRLFLYLAKLHL